LGLYYGLTLGGGPAQTSILPQVKEAYLKIVADLADNQSQEAAQDVITDWMLVSRTSLAFAQTPVGRVPATGLDLFAAGASNANIQAILDSTKQVTLDEIINRALPSYYYEFVSKEEKEDIFVKITASDIERLTGLDQKLPPWVTLT